MKTFMSSLTDAVYQYQKMQKDLKECERVSPKEYGELLQKNKKRKRGKRK